MDRTLRCAAPHAFGWVALVAALLIAGANPVRAQSPDLAALIDDLVAANRILYTQGVVDGFGHVSVRHPTKAGHFLMARALAPGRVTRDDILEFDADGKPVKDGAPPIYSERFIHSEV